VICSNSDVTVLYFLYFEYNNTTTNRDNKQDFFLIKHDLLIPKSVLKLLMIMLGSYNTLYVQIARGTKGFFNNSVFTKVANLHDDGIDSINIDIYKRFNK